MQVDLMDYDSLHPSYSSFCWAEAYLLSAYILIGMTTYLKSSFPGIVISALLLASPKAHRTV